MRKLVPLLALLLLSSCASALPDGASPVSTAKQLLCIVTSCEITDTQIQGISGVPFSVGAAVIDTQRPGLSGILSLALGSKSIDALGVILPVTPQAQTGAKLVVCPRALASKCLAIPVNTPVTVWVNSLAGSPDLLLLKKVD